MRAIITARLAADSRGRYPVVCLRAYLRERWRDVVYRIEDLTATPRTFVVPTIIRFRIEIEEARAAERDDLLSTGSAAAGAFARKTSRERTANAATGRRTFISRGVRARKSGLRVEG